MAYTPSSGTLAFSSTALTLTIGPETAVSEWMAKWDSSPMGAGDRIVVSVQTKNSSGVFVEEDTIIISPSVAAPAAPAAGYSPKRPSRWYASGYGIQFVCTYTLGAGNSTYPTVDYELYQGF